MDQTPQPIAVKVANLSGQEMKDVPVTLTVAGKKGETQKVNLGAGSSMLVQFTHVFDTPGNCPITVVVGAEERGTPLNTVYFNARVMGKIPVVILNGFAVGESGGGWGVLLGFAGAIAGGESAV